METIFMHKGYYWTIDVTTVASGKVSLDIFFLKNGIQVMYNQRQSSFMLQRCDEKKAWAICRTMLDKADDASPYHNYTEDTKKRKKALQKFLKDSSSAPAGPLFDAVRQAWSDWENQQRTAQAEQLKQAVRRLSPDEIETAVAEAQVEDVHEL